MNFITITPKVIATRPNIENEIKVSFTKQKMGLKEYNKLTIYIGKSIADQISINSGDRLDFFYEDSNNKIWLLKKSIGYSGTKVGKAGKGNKMLILPLLWYLYPTEIKSAVVKHDLHEGGIRIYSQQEIYK